MPAGVQLIVVTKTHEPATIMEAYHAGQRLFGENKVQELQAKQGLLPPDIQWHMVGHLQSNKVKYIAPFISLIHSVDSLKLLRVIDREATKNQRVIPCLLQLHIADETTKFGMSFAECCRLLESEAFQNMAHVEIMGVMGMATFTDDQEQVRREFRELREHCRALKQKYFASRDSFREISMGMSDDYRIGVEEGSTMVRIGTAIFGERE